MPRHEFVGRRAIAGRDCVALGSAGIHTIHLILAGSVVAAAF